MFSLTSIILAFLAGILGTFIGGTQTFICTGFIGIIAAILSCCGFDTAFFNDMVLNTLFLPCIIFNGAAFATAYASKNHQIRGVETSRSLAFTNDGRVLLAGALAGILGYMIYAFENYYAFPVDTGIFGIAVSAVMAFFAKETGLYTIGFSISAMSLIFALIDPAFPATHHTTLIAGYAIMQTGQIPLAIIFGLLAHLLSLVFAMVFNTDCGTHIDPPAVAIATFSFIIFAFF